MFCGCYLLTYLCIYLFICLFIFLFIYLCFFYLSMYLCICLYVYLCMYVIFYLFTYIFLLNYYNKDWILYFIRQEGLHCYTRHFFILVRDIIVYLREKQFFKCCFDIYWFGIGWNRGDVFIAISSEWIESRTDVINNTCNGIKHTLIAGFHYMRIEK